jgi:membrane fusion protein (multidrug efflux system)
MLVSECDIVFYMNCSRAHLDVRPPTRIVSILCKVLLCLWGISPTLLISACHSNPVVAANQPIPVQVRTPNQAQQPDSIAVSGSVEANATAMTAFETSGRVRRVFVDEGQYVVKGKLLAEIDPTDYQHGYEAASGTYAAALASEQKARNGLRPEELEQARIALERAQDEYRRMRYLHDRKSLDTNDFLKFEAAYLSARQNYEMAQKGTRTEDKQAVAGQTRTAMAQMQDAKTHLAKCRLVAPISGFIGMKHVNAGDFVAAGTPVFSVLDLDVAKVRVAIPEGEIGKIHVGSNATVIIPSLPGHSFQGSIDVLGMTADPLSRTYTGKIAVANPEHLLRDGMVSETRIYGPAQVHVLSIPANTVVRDPHGVAVVYVYDASRHIVFARRVETDAFLGSEIVIKSGLKAQDQVVIAGQQNLFEGAPVTLTGGAR